MLNSVMYKDKNGDEWCLEEDCEKHSKLLAKLIETNKRYRESLSK